MKLAPALDMSDISYSYPDAVKPILRNATWEIQEGDFALIAGPSGSGKSTLLRTMNGLVPHFTGGSFGGEVRVVGLDTRDCPTRMLAGAAGFVFQEPDVLSVTGRVDDDICFAMEQQGIPPTIMRRRLEELLDTLGIAHLRTREIHTLSGGERQRVAIASALALQAPILILDEPTSQLDPVGAEEVFSALQRLNEDLGTTVVLSEHRLERILGSIDTVRFISEDGHAWNGSPEDVLPQIEQDLLPPVVRLGVLLGLDPLPMTIKSGRRRIAASTFEPKLISPARPSDHGSPVVAAEQLKVVIDEQPVVNRVTFTVGEGEVVTLMGRNGSGKTTLLKSLMGLLPIAGGRVRVADQTHPDLDTHSLARRVGYLPQRARSLLYRETVEQELRAACALRSRDTGDAARLACRFGLEDFLRRHPFDLSVGEQERLALALTFAGSPDLILLDEPTRGVDYRRKRDLAELIRERSSEGAATIVATHDVEFAAQVASRVTLLGDGDIVADGPVGEVLSESLTYAPQMSKLFGRGYLTFEDVIAG